MRFAVIALVAACGRPSSTPLTPPLVAVEVATAHACAVLPAGMPVPPIAILDERGLRVVPPPATWDALGAFAPPANAPVLATPTDLAEEVHARGELMRSIAETLLTLPPGEDSAEALAELAHDVAAMPRPVPRIPVEPRGPRPPQQGFTLDEGKMGQRPHDDGGPNLEFIEVDRPAREAVALGYLADDNRVGHVQLALVMPAPTVRADAVVAVIAATSGLLGVRQGTAIRPLRLDFRHVGSTTAEFLELRVTERGVELAQPPRAPVAMAWKAGALDLAALHAALHSDRFDPLGVVDVLVDPTVSAQRLIDVLVALDAEGMTAIGLGYPPDDREIARRLLLAK